MKFSTLQNCLIADLIFSYHCFHGLVISNTYICPTDLTYIKAEIVNKCNIYTEDNTTDLLL
jgi:hypothetical protein